VRCVLFQIATKLSINAALIEFSRFSQPAQVRCRLCLPKERLVLVRLSPRPVHLLLHCCCVASHESDSIEAAMIARCVELLRESLFVNRLCFIETIKASESICQVSIARN